MKKLSRLLFAVMTFCSASAIAAESLNKIQKSMINDLQTIKQAFEAGYAPFEWKQELLDWDFDDEFKKAKKKVAKSPLISIKEYRKIVKEFLYSTQDCHVGVIFSSTEVANLPFSIKGAEGRYFITWIDDEMESSSLLNAEVGDEILSINNLPIEVIVNKIKNSIGTYTNLATNQGFAEMFLTYRPGYLGMDVPFGPANVKTIRKDSRMKVTSRLSWDYSPEKIHDIFPLQRSLGKVFSKHKEKMARQIPKTLMMNVAHKKLMECCDSPYDLGSTEGYLPPLGEIVWTNEDKDLLIPWHAYVYQNNAGQNIGFIRIPHYLGESEDVESFGDIINYFEENTDALVIDQLNNPGGYLSFSMNMASVLATGPIIPAQHRIKMTQALVLESLMSLEMIDEFINFLDLNIEELQDNMNSDSNSQEEVFAKAENFLDIFEDSQEGSDESVIVMSNQDESDESVIVVSDQDESEDSSVSEDNAIVMSDQDKSEESVIVVSDQEQSEDSSVSEDNAIVMSDQDESDESVIVVSDQEQSDEKGNEIAENSQDPEKPTLSELVELLEKLYAAREFYVALINEWNQGKVLTDPHYLEGITSIDPHPDYSYSKPILMLINEMDISCGDFTPAMLQDAGRVTLLGTTTAGAGGAVSQFSFPNQNGILMVSYTITLGQRVNDDKIENVGVDPDIDYAVTADDIQNGYRNYIQVINDTVSQMIN